MRVQEVGLDTPESPEKPPEHPRVASLPLLQAFNPDAAVIEIALKA